MEGDTVTLVRGKQTVRIEGEALRAHAARHMRTVIDLGTGDGRWIYRLARTHPGWFCLGVDANAGGMRETSFRSARKPSRGGVRNVSFVRCSVETLPHAFDRLADEIHVYFPWGSLLKVMLGCDPLLLVCIARLGKPGASLRVRINATILEEARLRTRLGLASFEDPTVAADLHNVYAAAGIRLAEIRVDWECAHTSWNRRLARGHRERVIALDGTIRELSMPPQRATWALGPLPLT